MSVFFFDCVAVKVNACKVSESVCAVRVKVSEGVLNVTHFIRPGQPSI